MASKVTKVFTGIAGLPVCEHPHRELLKRYGKIIRMLEKLPKESKYRSITEQLIKERKNIVESTENPQDIEKKINAGCCEELIEHAEHELTLIETMSKYKPWEPLEEKPQPNQWKWPL